MIHGVLGSIRIFETEPTRAVSKFDELNSLVT